MNIFLRYAVATSYLPNPFYTRAYDARLLYILDGEGEIRFSDKVMPLKSGTLCYYPPGNIYWPHSSADKPLYFVTINFDFTKEYSHYSHVTPTLAVEKYDEALMLPSHLNQPYEMFKSRFVLYDLHNLRDDFLAVANLSTSSRLHRRDAAGARLASILYTLLDISDTKQSNAVSQAIDYIERNLSKIDSNDTVADILHYHPNHLNRLFKEQLGITVHRYITEARIKKATELLSQSEMSISEISEAVGFKNPNHFSYVFTKLHGTSPTSFRRSSKLI